MKKRIATICASALILGTGVVGIAHAAPGPNGHNEHGLCTAYYNGSENGQAHKHKAPPFVALEAAADAQNQTVAEYCSGLVGGRAGKTDS